MRFQVAFLFVESGKRTSNASKNVRHHGCTQQKKALINDDLKPASAVCNQFSSFLFCLFLILFSYVFSLRRTAFTSSTAKGHCPIATGKSALPKPNAPVAQRYAWNTQNCSNSDRSN